MKRRSFLKYSSLFSTPLLIGGIPVASVARSALSGMINEESDRVLILVQLNGGNDGLSTIVPIDQYDVLANLRSNIIVPENNLLNIGDKNALHPSMIGMKDLYDNGKMTIIQNVGYPEQNRSHFRSLDIWHTGSAADEYYTTGWIGRYLDELYPGYPENYPNSEYTDPFAVTIGSVVSETCQGAMSNFSMTLVDPNNLSSLSSPVNNSLIEGCGSDQLAFITNAIEQTNEYGDRLKEAFELGNNLSSKYDEENNLAANLKTVARLISGGLQSKIYVVNLGGFDTHADQTVEGDPMTGTHANLLSILSSAISAFQDDIEKLGLKERVLGMTYSEFGRRIRSNFSLGTDHGDAAPLIVFGNCINAGIIGNNPQIDPNVTQDQAVEMEIDFRSIYGSVLIDWFDADENLVQSLFSNDFEYIPIVNVCSTSTGIQEPVNESVRIYPNPSSDMLQVEFKNDSWARIEIIDNLGRSIKVVLEIKQAGSHSIPININSFPPGNYFLRINEKERSTIKKFVKI